MLPTLLLLWMAPLASGRQFHVPSLLETLCSLCRSLGADGVVFQRGGEHAAFGATGDVRLQLRLAKRQVPVLFARLDDPPPEETTLRSWGGRPLAVLFSVDNSTAALLRKKRLSAATWVVLSTGEKPPDALLRLVLPVDGRLLVASPGLGLSVDLVELWAARPGPATHQHRWATWVPRAGLVRFDAAGPATRRYADLQGSLLSVAVVHNPPVTELKNVNGSLEVHGYFGNVWHILEKRLNFSSKYVIPEDQSTGKSLGDVSCDGMLGLLRCKKVDVALGAFSYGAHDTAVLEYTIPLLFTSYRIFIRRPPGDTMHWNNFLRPFSCSLWLCVLCAVLVVALCLSLCHRVGRLVGNEEALGPSRFGFLDSLLAVYGAFCSQGQDVTPRSTPCRAAFITAYLTSLTLLASYSAALISSITISKTSLPFTDLEGILADGSFHFGFVNQSEIFFYFTDSNNSVRQRAYRQLVQRNPANLPPDPLTGLRRACDARTRFAFMATEENALALARRVDCALVALPAAWRMINLAVAVAAASPFRAAFDRCLHVLRDDGILHKHRRYDGAGGGPDPRAPSFSSVTLTAVVPILAVLGVSCTASLALLLLERHWQRRHPPAAASAASGAIPHPWGVRAERSSYRD